MPVFMAVQSIDIIKRTICNKNKVNDFAYMSAEYKQPTENCLQICYCM